MSNSVYWLIASAALLALEAFGIPGVGFLFAGLAAIIVAAVTALGLIQERDIILQWALFFILTTASAALLWNKLKTWRMNPNAPHYSNIVGTEATVTLNGLAGDAIGDVLWSGTTMRARLADPAAAPIQAGSTVKVVKLEGNVLIVTAK